jgi:16S rRNA (uracil1498-N3)-methyltransferase
LTTARFLVISELLHGPSAILTGAELQHLRARRLRVGSELVLSDGLGCQRRGVLVQLDRQRAVIDMVAELSHEARSLHVVLAQALLKSQRLDWVIEKATELGVSELMLFTCERTVVQPNSERQARWQRVAASAAKQCQRS